MGTYFKVQFNRLVNWLFPKRRGSQVDHQLSMLRFLLGIKHV